MKTYESKRGAQNAATRLNKIESANNTLKFWEVEMILVDRKFVYVIENASTGISEYYGS